jgi:glycosyltransferase involved in cell wall biosynthesis
LSRIVVDLLSYTGTKGGMETYARELYRQLGAMSTGHEYVGLASREFMALDHSWFPGEVVDSGYSGENRFHWAFGELFGVGRAAKRLGADLIHAPATLGPARAPVPVVVTMHDLLYFSHPQLMSTPFYTEPVKWMERLVSRRASVILTDSESSKAEIEKYLQVESERIRVVPLAGTAAEGSVVDVHRRRPDLLLALGNRRPHKNFDGLVRSLALVDEEVRPRLVVTGSRGEDPLRPIVDELGLGRWVDLRSWVSPEDLDELFATATAMVMPSFCDGFCLPALDAMLVGLPVMLSGIPVYREVGGDAALYFDPSELTSIAAAITRLVTEPGLPERLAALGHVQVTKFSWERAAQETLDAFTRVLGAH